MMDLGFIQAAAPASQTAPLTDPSLASASGDDGAFDAALSATLATADVDASRGNVISGRATQPAWLFASFLTATVTGFDATTPTTAEGEEIAIAEPASTPVEPGAEDESSDEITALAADVAVPVPWVAEIKAPVVPQQVTAAVQAPESEIAVDGEQPARSTVFGSHVPQADPQGTADAVASSEQVLAVPAKPTVSSQAVPAKPTVSSQAVPAKPTVSSQAVAPNAPVQREVANVSAAPTATANGRVDEPIATNVANAPTVVLDGAPEAVTRPSTDQRGIESQARARATVEPQQMASADIAAQLAAAGQADTPTTAVANAVAAAAEAAPAPAPAPAPARSVTPASSEAADSAVLPRLASGSSALSGQDAQMTGQDQQSGQGRQSADFMRFAAALAQVTSAGTDDSSRAPAVASQVAAAPAAPPAAAAAAVVTTAAAPAATAETPDADNVGRLVQAMRVIARPGAWEATVRLKPEQFGDVTIALRVERNAVSAVVNAEAAGVRQWLESQEQAVRTGMAEHGLQLERFIVQRDGQRRDPHQHEQHDESRRRSPRRQPAPTERFEIVV